MFRRRYNSGCCREGAADEDFYQSCASDKELVKTLADRLSKDGHKVWNEDRELLPGDNWASKVADAMESSEAMVIVLSPDATKSQSVRREIEYALGTEKYKNRLVTVVTERTEDVPWILTKLPLVRVRKRNFAEAGQQVAEQFREVVKA